MKKLFKLIMPLRGLHQATGRGHHRPHSFNPLHHRRQSLAERLLRRITRR